ncbi:MAG: hypothetical protein RIS36_232 [Pseudomonadota bacterium]
MIKHTMLNNLRLLCIALLCPPIVAHADTGTAAAEPSNCLIYSLTNEVHRELGPYNAYNICGDYANGFKRRCGEWGLNCQIYKMYCEGAGHAVVVVRLDGGRCIVANPTSTQDFVFGPPFPCSELDDGKKTMPPEGCGPTATSKERTTGCECSFEPVEAVHKSISRPWTVAQMVFRDMNLAYEVLVTVATGMNKYELCYALCTQYANEFSAEASTEQEKQIANKWHKECFSACDNYFKESIE